MTTAPRRGPLLTIAASCDGCPHVSARPAGPAFESFCDHVRAPEQNTIREAGALGLEPIATPSWCPELPAANEALARELRGTDPVRCPACGEPVPVPHLPTRAGRSGSACRKCLTPFAIRAWVACEAEPVGGGR